MVRLKAIAKGEERLVEEVKDIVNSGRNLPNAEQHGVKPHMVKAVIEDFDKADMMPATEAVVVPFMRPVLFVRSGKIELPASDELKERIFKYKSSIERTLKSVGRIELINHQLKYGGTGWLITEDVIVTNRHVAMLFAEKNKKEIGGRFIKNFMGVSVGAKIDLKEEYIFQAAAISNQFEMEVEKIVFLADDGPRNPDIALLRIKKRNGLPEPIPFIENLKVDQLMGVVGYPAKDPRGVTDEEMERRIFGEIFGVKRYAPGQIIAVPKQKWFFAHDASTLGGNSGSLIQDMETGCALGLHFSGVLLQANYAVKGKEILNAATKAKITGFKSTLKPATTKIIVPHEFVQEKTYQESSYEDRKGFKEDFLGNGASNYVSLPLIKKKRQMY